MGLAASERVFALIDLAVNALTIVFQVFVTGHASNMKIIDPLLRQIKYDTGAMVCVYKPYAENYFGMIADLLEGPPEETPGWHAGELETANVLAHDISDPTAATVKEVVKPTNLAKFIGTPARQ